MIESLAPDSAPSLDTSPITWSELAVELRPHEIATLYIDLVLGRKVGRDLDAHRSVWATVHRVNEHYS
jgi:alpha-mannosidase